ncbi:MAG: glycosyltransferase [Candidatus Binatia bacterium]
MRIIQALGWYYPESLGGTEVYVAGLSRRLRGAGHEIIVAAPDPTHSDERMYEHEGVPVYRYPIPRSPTRAECQGTAPVRGTERFHAWLQRERPDVVHMHTFVTGLGLPELKAAKASGARVIVTTHAGSLGYICQRGTMMRWGVQLCDGVCELTKCTSCELQHRGLPRPLARVVAGIPHPLGRVAGRVTGRVATALGMRTLIIRNQAMQREMLSAVDKFVLLTQWAQDAVVANGAPTQRLFLNRLGVSQENITRKPAPHVQPTQTPVTIGYLGRFDPVKGVGDLIRAVAGSPRDLPIRIELRGPCNSVNDERRVGELRRALDDDPRVAFAPPVRPAEVSDLLARHDVLCCPSRSLEGGPTVAIEAHAVGTPVVGTRIGGLAELVTDRVNGRLVAPGDWRALAGVFHEMAANPAGTIDSWRRSLPPARTMDEVTAEYLTLYGA